MACRFDSRGVWTCIVYAFLTAGVADNPVRPAPTELSTRIYCFEHFDDFHSNAPRNLALQTMPELTLTSKGNLAASGMTPKLLLFLQTTSPTLCAVALVVIVCLVLYWIERLVSKASILKGDFAQFKDLAAAALHKHQSDVSVTLNRQHTHLSKLAKSAGHRRYRKQGLKQAVKLKRLRQRILKQEQRIRQLKAQQAQHAQHIQGLTHCLGTNGVACCHMLMQLAVDVKEGNVRQMELSSQVRANTRAQNLLTRLAGVIDELRVQLQVSVGTQETVKTVATEMTQLKQDLTNIKGTRQQLQQQTGMLAELRYELKTNADSRQDLQTRTASLENMHALMSQSLRTKNQHTGPTSLRSPKRSASRLAAVTEAFREVSEDGTTPLLLESAHKSVRSPPHSLPLSAHSYMAAIHDKTVQHSFTPEPTRQPRLSDYQDLQAANYRSRSMQQGQPPLPAHGRQFTRQSGSHPGVVAAQTESGLPPGRKLRKMISYPPAGAKSLDHSVCRSLLGGTDKAKAEDRTPLPLRLPTGVHKSHSTGDVQNVNLITPAPAQNYIAAVHGKGVPVSPRPSPFEVAAGKATGAATAPLPLRLAGDLDNDHMTICDEDEGQALVPLQKCTAAMHGQGLSASAKPSPFESAAQKAKGDAKAPAASGTRVIDQVNKSHNVLELSDLYKPSKTMAREPSLRTAALRRSHQHEHYMRPKPKSAEELRRPLDNQQHRSMGKQRRSAGEQHLVFEDGHARSKEEQQWSAENRRKNCEEEYSSSMDNHRRSTEELSSSFEDQRDDAECLDAQGVRGEDALLPPGMLPRVPVSPFATDKGNTPEAKSGHDPLMPQRPTQEADPRPQAPGLPPKPPQPAHSVPAAPQAVPDDQTASGLTLPHDLQDPVGPKSSLLKQMGKHSRKPLKALVKTFRKEL